MLLQSQRLKFRAVTAEDMPLLLAFFNDFERNRLYLPGRLQSLNAEQLWAQLQTWQEWPESMLWIFTDLDGTALGLINLEGIDPFQGIAECGVALLNPAAEGHGYAYEAMQVLLAYAFGELRLERLTARYMDGNTASAKLFAKLGFQAEGRLRRYQRRGSERLDMLLSGLLRSEYEAGLQENSQGGNC